MSVSLNPQQHNVIESSNQHLLVVAGPGTGKTHTLTLRVARVAQDLATGQKVLAVTFTHKAAGEMSRRLNQLDPKLESRVSVGTFHAVCLELLREWGDERKVISPEEQEKLSSEIWPETPLKERRRLLEKISCYKSIRYDESEDVEVISYQQYLQENNMMDFDDLLLSVFFRMKDQQNLLKNFQDKYLYIFVDEYQDINRLQHDLLRLWTGESGHLTAIGDPRQAIYGFRGSDVSFFQRFSNDYPGAEVLSMSDNYRSSANLLEAAGQLIARSRQFDVPELTARIYQEGRLTIHQSATDRAEAEFVVHSIEKLVGGTSMFSQDSGRVVDGEEGEFAFGDVVVLYRLNAQRFVLQEALERSGIPYQVSGVKPEAKADDAAGDLRLNRPDEIHVEGEKISLMTLHAAKGLEFPVVFIVGCEDSIVPLNWDGMTGDKEEERRLFYVGMTRAKNRLYLLHAARRRLYGKTCQLQASSFLSDIEDRLKAYELQREAPRRKKEKQMDLFG